MERAPAMREVTVEVDGQPVTLTWVESVTSEPVLDGDGFPTARLRVMGHWESLTPVFLREMSPVEWTENMIAGGWRPGPGPTEWTHGGG